MRQSNEAGVGGSTLEISRLGNGMGGKTQALALLAALGTTAAAVQNASAEPITRLDQVQPHQLDAVGFDQESTVSGAQLIKINKTRDEIHVQVTPGKRFQVKLWCPEDLGWGLTFDENAEADGSLLSVHNPGQDADGQWLANYVASQQSGITQRAIITCQKDDGEKVVTKKLYVIVDVVPNLEPEDEGGNGGAYGLTRKGMKSKKSQTRERRGYRAQTSESYEGDPLDAMPYARADYQEQDGLDRSRVTLGARGMAFISPKGGDPTLGGEGYAAIRLARPLDLGVVAGGSESNSDVLVDGVTPKRAVAASAHLGLELSYTLPVVQDVFALRAGFQAGAQHTFGRRLSSGEQAQSATGGYLMPTFGAEVPVGRSGWAVGLGAGWSESVFSPRDNNFVISLGVHHRIRRDRESRE